MPQINIDHLHVKPDICNDLNTVKSQSSVPRIDQFLLKLKSVFFKKENTYEIHLKLNISNGMHGENKMVLGWSSHYGW